MTSEERQQQINTLVERLRELDLKKRAMDLVLQDFLEQRKKDAERLSKLDEMLHIAVSVILANIVVKLSSVQKSGELGKNVFVLEHNSHLNLTAKLRNQVRFIPKYHLIDCISINSKSCQSTLTGQ